MPSRFPARARRNHSNRKFEVNGRLAEVLPPPGLVFSKEQNPALGIREDLHLDRPTTLLQLCEPGPRFPRRHAGVLTVEDPQTRRVQCHPPAPRQPARVLRDTFDADYALCDTRSTWQRFHMAMMQDEVAVPLVLTGSWKVYRLRPEA